MKNKSLFFLGFLHFIQFEFITESDSTRLFLFVSIRSRRRQFIDSKPPACMHVLKTIYSHSNQHH